jgi:pimeloyl-ACP methyl ester carboxylesterase
MPKLTPVERSSALLSSPLKIWEGGKGKPVVILHGGGGPESWIEFASQFEGRATYLPEHPGFGAGGIPAWLSRVEDYAYFYLHLLADLDLRDVHLVGHSLGGWIAAEIAIRDASRLGRLTLIAPAGLRVPGVPPADNFLWSPQETISNLFFDEALAAAHRQREPAFEQQMLTAQRQQVLASLVWSPRWFSPQLSKWLRRMRTPTQIIWGGADRLFPVAHCQAWADAIPGAEWLILNECGHIPHVEKPQATMSALLAPVWKVA